MSKLFSAIIRKRKSITYRDRVQMELQCRSRHFGVREGLPIACDTCRVEVYIRLPQENFNSRCDFAFQCCLSRRYSSRVHLHIAFDLEQRCNLSKSQLLNNLRAYGMPSLQSICFGIEFIQWPVTHFDGLRIDLDSFIDILQRAVPTIPQVLTVRL